MKICPTEVDNMSVSKAQQKAVTKYVKSNYDRFGLTMLKGQLDIIKAHAAARGESVNGFIGRAIAEAMNRDNGGGTDSRTDATQKPTERTDGGGVTPIPFDVETPSEAAQKAGQGA